ncbi:MarR family winged helix-turn-helix transcriptional regulator [Rhizobium sp. L1K21]|uniref:MarR family winged helix-turn-helix transcriptional regulator n=1 Tax=Rhizobium sp. L1K21 TaxID=2954933 RepID=UPI00209270F9|nr:MarR family winged helix-turn-helix transcriptional regulator [Rhizobium sp. L1K21]MCO6184721.1 MarR family winged helix-turn-helix transcriptional regulator [Rhizobium sp. L1K21]
MTSRTDPQSLGFLLTDISRLLRADFERRINRAGLGMTAGEARTLLRIDALSGCRQNTLAENMSIEPMTVCRYVDRLEAQELAMREPDPVDRRAKIVTLTDAGRVMVDRIREHTAEMLEDLQTGLDPDQRKALKLGLLTLRENLTAFNDLPALANG